MKYSALPLEIYVMNYAFTNGSMIVHPEMLESLKSVFKWVGWVKYALDIFTSFKVGCEMSAHLMLSFKKASSNLIIH